MDRRGFLKALATAAGALGYAAVAPQTVSALLSPDPVASEAAAKLTLEWMTKEVNRLLSHQVGPLTLVTDGQLGEGKLRHQWGVSLTLPSTDAEANQYRERYLVPTVASLADGMRHERVTHCGVLPLPTHVHQGAVVSDKTRGISVRGLEFYRVDIDQMELRFDVIAG